MTQADPALMSREELEALIRRQQAMIKALQDNRHGGMRLGIVGYRLPLYSMKRDD